MLVLVLVLVLVLILCSAATTGCADFKNSCPAFSPPRNFTDEWDDLSHMKVPGELGDYSCTKTDPGNSTRGPDDVFACYQSYVLKCDSQLSVWRKMEQKKNVAKVFTIVAIVIGIAILGIISGVRTRTAHSLANNFTHFQRRFIAEQGCACRSSASCSWRWLTGTRRTLSCLSTR